MTREGSGHILVYAFDVLMEIYKESGYAERDAAQLIVKNNLFGLDIDNRAYQLAYFAVMMKARRYDRRFLTRDIEPNVSAIMETNELSKFDLDGITNDKIQNRVGEYLIKIYKDAKEIGSLISVEKNDYSSFIEYLHNCSGAGQLSIESDYWFREIKPVMEKIAIQASIMSKKFSIVCTNPPYMNKLEGQLKRFVVEEYKPYSGDLFSVFMRKNFDYCNPNGYLGFMTPFVWMFIKKYEQLREYILTNKSISTLVQMEYSAYEEATVPICSFVLKNAEESEKGLYIKLSDFKGGMETQKQKVLEALNDKACNFIYETRKENFSKITGSPIAYWVSEKAFVLCAREKVFEYYATTRAGMITGNNNLFMRMWYEVDYMKFGIHFKSREDAAKSKKKWFPYNKGGDYRKWYGNNDYVVNWENDGSFMRNFKDSTGKIPAHAFNLEYIFKENVTWSSLSSYKFAARYTDYGFLYDASGSFADIKTENLYYTLAFLCSEVALFFLSAMNPTLNYQKGNISSLPFIISDHKHGKVDKLAKDNIDIARSDWDLFETSWDFKMHPLLRSCATITEAYTQWDTECNERFAKLKANEEELNRIFIEIYGLQDELTPDVEDKDVTVRLADLKREIRSLMSYAVGCMFGRYSLDEGGLTHAGGNWNVSNNKSFVPDNDNIIPITDEDYFQDDILGRFVDFIKAVYGLETLEENLDFIANALGNGGNSSRDIIRNYFIKDFFKDHCKVYQKRPIYWLFDSGNQNGFKALIYMHRYDENTIGNLRIDYLHRMQRIFENEIGRMQDTIENSKDVREVTAATKRKEKLIKQLQETKEYDEKIAHLALARTSIDLDDGVKVNYEKIQTDRDGKKLDVLAKI